MSLALITLSPDLAQVLAEGYELEIRNAKLLVNHVPCLTAEGRPDYGTIISTLVLSGDVPAPPEDHTVFWVGPVPHTTHGQPLQSNGAMAVDLGEGPVPAVYFSRKPVAGKYISYHEKITAYVRYISGPARAVDSSVTAQTFRPVPSAEEDSVFCYLNTAVARGGIEDANHKLKGHRIAIVGTGGTGSYVLDYVSKTEVAEIHLFDGDILYSHNAFRTPGAASLAELRAAPKKVDWLVAQYSKVRHQLHAHPYDIDEVSVDELRSFDFVFVCMDAGPTKGLLLDKLQQFNVPLIDVGMGLRNDSGVITGRVRVTTGTAAKYDHIASRISRHEPSPDEYRTNIQVVELNALNAALAVIRWKKYLSFYADEEYEHHSLYVLPTNTLLNTDVK